LKIKQDIETSACNCDSKLSTAEIHSVVEKVVFACGTEKDKVIPILQGVQDKLNYLPSEALRHICEISEITQGQISGVATFYSQFRHIPAGEHTIKVCTGTACHVKGAGLVKDAFRRELSIDNKSATTEDGLFSIEEVACLGCCTLAPVVQIDNRTYGHVKTTEVNKIIDDILAGPAQEESIEPASPGKTEENEIRVGLGSCCIAGGSKDILVEVRKTIERYKLSASIKSVGCVGVCNQTPLLEFNGSDGEPVRYTNVKTEQVDTIVLEHIKPEKRSIKLLTRINDLLDTFHNDEKVASPINLPDNIREKYINNFLLNQKHIATEHYGELSPFSAG